MGLDANTGILLWRVVIGDTDPGGTIVEGEEVFVTNGFYVWALNKSNGEILWEKPVEDWITRNMLVEEVSHCCVLVSEVKGSLTAYDRNTGEIIWDFNAIDATARIDNDKVLIAHDGYSVIDELTGGVIWEETKPTSIRYAVYFQNGVAFSATGREVEAFDFNNRKILWKNPERQHVYTILGIGKYLIVGADQLYALNPQDGKLIWSTDWGGDKATIMDNRIYLLNSVKKQVRVFDLHTGKWLGSIQLALPSALQINYVSEAIGTYEDLLIVGVDERVYGFGQP